MKKKTIKVADLFCGAGGSSTGALEAIEEHGYRAELTAINHWPVAIATHSANHTDHRHLCTNVDDVKPCSLYARGELKILLASPECIHFTRARPGHMPKSDPMERIFAGLRKFSGIEFITAAGGPVYAAKPRSVNEPLHAVVEPFLVKASGDDAGERSKGLPSPMPTVTGRAEWALCEPALLPQHSGGQLRPVSSPVPTVAGAGAIGLVMPIVTVDGEKYYLDIRWRMLEPDELAAAQSFNPGYKFTGTKKEVLRQIGNAVPKETIKALVRAAL